MEYILKKSKNKGKRFVIEMPDLSHKHNFGAFPFEKGTYIDHGDDKIKKAWIARHKNDKNWNNKHSGIYYSRHLRALVIIWEIRSCLSRSRWQFCIP